MKFKHENLEIWQIAMELIVAVYEILKKCPKSEEYGLFLQGKKAVVSIALNIAEGSGRHTDKDFGAFINRSITSLEEVDTVLKIGIRLDFINKADYECVEQIVEKEYYKLIAFEKNLRKHPSRRSRYCERSDAAQQSGHMGAKRRIGESGKRGSRQYCGLMT
jgi:four helix bundle protein